MFMTIQSNVKDKILATPSETSKVENAPAEMLRDLDQQMEKRADDGRMKPRRVQAVAMTIQYGVPWVGSERDEAHASRSPVLWVEIGESSLTGLELVQETTDKIKVDKTLRFVEEPIENSDREVKRFLASLLDDGQGSGSWMFLFVWSGYAAMRTLLWAGKVVSCKISCES
ncbi:hypothetical protein Tco_1059819 [Tanacetum coccineum]